MNNAILDEICYFEPGIYHIEPSANKLGFLSPVFKKEGVDEFLYSHHPQGRIWLVGQSYTTW
jgi:hypothetical protein